MSAVVLVGGLLGSNDSFLHDDGIVELSDFCLELEYLLFIILGYLVHQVLIILVLESYQNFLLAKFVYFLQT